MKDIDEYTEEQLFEELARRRLLRGSGQCDYCGGFDRNKICRFPDRHLRIREGDHESFDRTFYTPGGLGAADVLRPVPELQDNRFGIPGPDSLPHRGLVEVMATTWELRVEPMTKAAQRMFRFFQLFLMTYEPKVAAASKPYPVLLYLKGGSAAYLDPDNGIRGPRGVQGPAGA